MKLWRRAAGAAGVGRGGIKDGALKECCKCTGVEVWKHGALDLCRYSDM